MEPSKRGHVPMGVRRDERDKAASPTASTEALLTTSVIEAK